MKSVKSRAILDGIRSGCREKTEGKMWFLKWSSVSDCERNGSECSRKTVAESRRKKKGKDT